MLSERLKLYNIEQTPVERRSKRLRHFLGALRRYRPLLVVDLGSPASTCIYVLVVADDDLDWATVDRLSDGVVQPVVFSESELRLELRNPDGLLAKALRDGDILYQRDESADRILNLLSLEQAKVVGGRGQ